MESSIFPMVIFFVDTMRMGNPMEKVNIFGKTGLIIKETLTKDYAKVKVNGKARLEIFITDNSVEIEKMDLGSIIGQTGIITKENFVKISDKERVI